MESTVPARMTAALEMARERLQLETLETRNSDRLDFHAIDVASIKDCVQIAFDEGFAAGRESALSLPANFRNVITLAMEARQIELIRMRDCRILTQDQFTPLHRETIEALAAIDNAQANSRESVTA